MDLIKVRQSGEALDHWVVETPVAKFLQPFHCPVQKRHERSRPHFLLGFCTSTCDSALHALLCRQAILCM